MSLFNDINDMVDADKEIYFLQQELEALKRNMEKRQKQLDAKIIANAKLKKKSYTVDCELLVEELAKLWGVPVEKMYVSAQTTELTKYDGDTRMQFMSKLNYAAISGTGKLILTIAPKNKNGKVSEDKIVQLVDKLNLYSAQKDGKQTSEHLSLVEKADYAYFEFDDYKQLIMNKQFGQTAMLVRQGILFNNLLDQACYNAIVAKENENESGADLN